MGVLSLLLALLELAKLGEVRLMQPRAFAAFEITRDSSSEAAWKRRSSRALHRFRPTRCV